MDLCAQVHCHFKQFLNVDLSPWTQVEDVQLLENVRSLIICLILSSVADPGSGAFLTPGSGIRNKYFPDP